MGTYRLHNQEISVAASKFINSTFIDDHNSSALYTHACTIAHACTILLMIHIHDFECKVNIPVEFGNSSIQTLNLSQEDFKDCLRNFSTLVHRFRTAPIPSHQLTANTDTISQYTFSIITSHILFWFESLALISKLRKLIGSLFIRSRLPGQIK